MTMNRLFHLLTLTGYCLMLSSSSSSLVVAAAAAAAEAEVEEGSTPPLLGGEKAYFHETKFPDTSVSHRTNVCPLWRRFNNGTLPLRDSLKGLELSVLMSWSEDSYFYYDEINGINSDYPGIEAVIIDELARRAGFTWRNSFGTFSFPPPPNVSNTEVLLWGVNTYDIYASWVTVKTSRMSKGISYVQPWYDGSPILVSKEVYVDYDNPEINLWNWTRPYDAGVWMMTIFTILLSAVVYQILEWFADDRQDRSWWEWTEENLYLSTINFTQAYEYEPKTPSMRIFGISMAIWALVMTATYTANLASLLVDRRPPPPPPQTIDEVFRAGESVCTLAGSSVDSFLAETYPKLRRVPKHEHPQIYKGLRNGDCDFFADTATSWSERMGQKDYNPTCDLYWVGGDRKLKERSGAMVTKADMGDYCSGFIREVLNVHMREMVDDGFLKDAWKEEHSKTQDLDCSVAQQQQDSSSDDDEEEGGAGMGRRRLNFLRSNSFTTQQQQQRNNNMGEHHHSSHHQPQDDHDHQHQHRTLKAGGGATGGAVAIAASSANGGGSDEDDRKLTVEQMIGTFFFHYMLMTIALVLAGLNALYQKYGKQYKFKTVTNSLASEVQYKEDQSFNGDHCKSSTTVVGASALCDSNNTYNGEQMAAMEKRLQMYLKKNLKNHETKMLLLDTLLEEKMQAAGISSGRTQATETSSASDQQLFGNGIEVEADSDRDASEVMI